MRKYTEATLKNISPSLDFKEALPTLEKTLRADKDTRKVIIELLMYIDSCGAEKYVSAPISTLSISHHSSLGKGANLHNVVKYIGRYATEGYSKSNNPADLQKAIHYILYELGRLNKEKHGSKACIKDSAL